MPIGFLSFSAILLFGLSFPGNQEDIDNFPEKDISATEDRLVAALVEVDALCKRYGRTKKLAVDHLSFQIEEGAIYAFVGPNGAGKTTTIRVLATLLAYDSGNVNIAGYRVDTHPQDVRRLLGYIPDEFGLYGDMLAHEYLTFFASCYGVAAQQRQSIVDDLLELVGLEHRRDDEVRSLSRGMRQRLGLARALVHDPLLIVADEPAAGLDPRARVELREIFRVLQDMGKTIFLSSHVLRELDDVATHMGIIEQGQLVISDTIEAVRAHLRPYRQVRIQVLGSPDDAHAWLSHHPNVQNVELVPNTNGNVPFPTFMLRLEGDEAAVVALLGELVSAKIPVLSYTEERETLESLFLSLTQGIVS
ncbi:MAG: ABC transporter ATP-binding protein [Anaerolineae bacterium]|nr:ABC transporter ATP-binding protein [Anaerolineae bacterium]